jgi:hypothetical protein
MVIEIGPRLARLLLTYGWMAILITMIQVLGMIVYEMVRKSNEQILRQSFEEEPDKEMGLI